MYEFISHVLEKWIVVGFRRTEGLRNMRMGLNVSSHLQYKIQQAKYQLDALAYNVGICYSTLNLLENICFSMDLIKVTLMVLAWGRRSK